MKKLLLNILGLILILGSIFLLVTYVWCMLAQ
jgi:hypothetical protein